MRHFYCAFRMASENSLLLQQGTINTYPNRAFNKNDWNVIHITYINLELVCVFSYRILLKKYKLIETRYNIYNK